MLQQQFNINPRLFASCLRLSVVAVLIAQDLFLTRLELQMFALLEHADESGRVPGSDVSNKNHQQTPKTDRVVKQQHLAYARQQQHGSNRPPSATQQTARAEEYYRAFVHVYRDPGKLSRCCCSMCRGECDCAQHLLSGSTHCATSLSDQRVPCLALIEDA